MNPWPSGSAEVALLLACARTAIDTKRAERIRALVQNERDWPGLIKLARRHAVLPLLYRSLETICPEAVPPAVLTRLQQFTRTNTQRNLTLTRELLRLLERCEACGISALPFKGPLLATAAYGDLGLRQFIDLDILLPQQQVWKATELLLTQGYQPLLQLSPYQHKIYLRTNYNYGLRHTEKRVCVELHWGFAPTYFSFGLEPASVWERVEYVRLADRPVPTLALTDVLLMLCAHGTKHCWTKLGWICDIVELIERRPEIDWSCVMARTKALGAERMLLLGLHLGQTLLGGALPAAVRDRIQADATTSTLTQQIAATLFQEPHDWSKSLAGILFRLRARERLRDKVQYGVRFILTPTSPDVLRPLPFVLSSLLRPIRLLGDHAPAEWQALRKRLLRVKNEDHTKPTP